WWVAVARVDPRCRYPLVSGLRVNLIGGVAIVLEPLAVLFFEEVGDGAAFVALPAIFAVEPAEDDHVSTGKLVQPSIELRDFGGHVSPLEGDGRILPRPRD